MARVDLSEGEGGTVFGLKGDVHEGFSTEQLVEKEGVGSESDGINEVEEEEKEEEEEEDEEDEEDEKEEPSDEESREGVSLFMGQSPLQSGVQATVAKRKRKKKTRSLAKSSAAVQMELQRQEVCTI